MIRKNYSCLSFLCYPFNINFIFNFKGSGFYGFGNDYYVIYFEIIYLGVFLIDWVGLYQLYLLRNPFWCLHYINSSISFGYLLRSVFKLKNLNNTLFFLYITDRSSHMAYYYGNIQRHEARSMLRFF